MNLTNDFSLPKTLLTRSLLAALALSVPMMTACATTQTHGAQLDDENLKNAVGRALSGDDVVKRAQIDVDVIASVVYLRGEVSNQSMKATAERVAAGVDGVTRVENQLVAGRDSDVGDGHPDAWITTTIATKLTVDSETKSRNIDVDTEDGVVTLSGIVETEEARKEAGFLAQGTDGVSSVVNELQVAAKE